MKPALVILAGGASRRLGQPKLLARVSRTGDPDRTVLDHILQVTTDLCQGQPLIVAGKDHDLIVTACANRAQVLRHTKWQAGRTGSVAAGVVERPESALLLWPADSPCLHRSDLLLLLREFQEAPPWGWLAPRCPDGRFGHPLLLGQRLASEVLRLSPDQPLREVRSLARPLLAVDLPHFGARINLDTPSNLEQARAWFAQGNQD